MDNNIMDNNIMQTQNETQSHGNNTMGVKGKG